jgi:hypothetical protein
MATLLRWRLVPLRKPAWGRGANSGRWSAEIRNFPGSGPDRLGYDAWVLPPLPGSRGECWIRRISMLGGPLLLALTGALIFALILYV